MCGGGGGLSLLKEIKVSKYVIDSVLRINIELVDCSAVQV